MEKILVPVGVAFCCLFLIGFTNSLPEDHLLSRGHLKEESHSIYQCPDPSNLTATPLCRYNIKESGKFLQTITKTINCPESGINKIKIACVIVHDNVEDDKGGYASITSGGLNSYSVSINLKSQLSRGIDFTVEVYLENSTTIF